MTAEPRDVEEIRGDIARVPRPGEQLPDRSLHGWIGIACRLRDDADALLARLAAADRENAELRGEVTKVVTGLRSMQFSKYRNQPDWAWMNAGGLANRLDAALSAAPQPEPCEHPATFDGSLRCPTCMQAIRAKSPQIDAVMRSIEEYRNAPSGTASVPRQPEPPASDEPARCEHGRTGGHWRPFRDDDGNSVRCPGPTASGAPDAECRHCGGSGNAHTFDGADLGICGTCHGTGSAAGGGL